MHFKSPLGFHSFGLGISFCIFFLTVFGFLTVEAGGVRGFVKDEKGEPLAFTTIFVKQTGSGTTTNVNGDYEIALSPGQYDIVYQFLGYETVERHVDVAAAFVEVNIT